MLRQRQGGVNVNPKTFGMAFELLPTRRWLSCDTLTLLYCKSAISQQSQHIVRCCESVYESQMELMIGEVECRQQICDGRTYFGK